VSSWVLLAALCAGVGVALAWPWRVVPVSGGSTEREPTVRPERSLRSRRLAVREREAVAADLPHLVALLAAGLRSGAAPGPALEAACAALPGPAAEVLQPVRTRLRWGAEPGDVWRDLAADPDLGDLGVAQLGRSLARASETGASVVGTVEALADHLAAESRAGVEDRARAVGVRAALPLGTCLLPAFLLLGIVPLVVGLATRLSWG